MDLSPETDFSRKILDFAIVTLTTCAAFLFIFRTGNIKDGIVKPFDFLIAITGLFLLFSLTYPHFRNKIKSVKKDLYFYLFSFFLILLSIAIGQVISLFFYGNTNISATTLLYIKVIFNSYVFLIIAFLVYSFPGMLSKINKAMFLSPILIIPVIFGRFKNAYYNSIRLNGLFSDPNVFGSLLIVIFLIGLALFLDAKKAWYKYLIVGWLGFIANLIFLTSSRSAWISLLFGIFIWVCIYFFTKQKKRVFSLIVATTISLVVGFFFIPNNTKPYFIDRFFGEKIVRILIQKENLPNFVSQYKYGLISNQIRPFIWKFALVNIKKNPLGFGFVYLNKNPSVIKGEAVDFTSNIFLEITIYGGIMGLFAFLLFLLRIGGEFKRYMKTLTDTELVWGIAIISLITDLSFTDGFLFRNLWFTLGIGLGIILIKKYPQKTSDVSAHKLTETNVIMNKNEILSTPQNP